MPQSSQQGALPRKASRYITAGVVLVGTGIITVNPAIAPLPRVHLPDIQLTTSEADIVIDFVRHAQTASGNVVASNGLPGSWVNGLPGYPLNPDTANGWEQAITTGNTLATELGSPSGVNGFPVGGVEGIFGGYEQRMIETILPFLSNEGLPYTPSAPTGFISPDFTPLTGLDEINGGIAAGDPLSSPGGILSELIALSWVLGLLYVPAPGSQDWIGVVLDENFTSAVDTMYGDAAADPNPIISATGQITDIAVSGEGALSTWTLLNVNNPDLAIFIPLLFESLASGDATPFLANGGVIQIEGNPTDGWTLVNWDGTPIPANPGLLTELVVDARNVIIPPQLALYNVLEAALSGNLTTIETQLSEGLQSIGAALVQFPESVITDISTEVQNLFADVAAGASLSAAFDSTIVGLP